MTETLQIINSQQIIREIVGKLANSNRNLVSDEFADGLKCLQDHIDLKVHRYKTGMPCWTWNVPPKWQIKEGYIKQGGREIVSIKKHPLHVMSYSIPVKKRMKGEELLEHIHVHRELPDAIPYEFSFYKPQWGFCMTHAQRNEIKADQDYDVCIDSESIDDHLSVGEFTIKGQSDEYIVFLGHLDHPCQVNDGLIGAAVNVALANRLKGQQHYYNYMFLFVPETIGSIAFLSHNEHLIPKIRYAVFNEMVGFKNPLILQKSYDENTLINQYALAAMETRQGKSMAYPFLTVAGNDEKIFDSPGVAIPAISVTRVNQEECLTEKARRQKPGTVELVLPYPQYHSHLDNTDLIDYKMVGETVEYLNDLVNILEKDFIPVRKFKGPVFLTKYNLWIDWRSDIKMSEKMLWLMYSLEGEMTAFQISRKLDMDFGKTCQILEKFLENGLIEKGRIPIGFDR